MCVCVCVCVCVSIHPQHSAEGLSDSETPTQLPKSAHMLKYFLKETVKEKEG